jgi:hypothetical protein
LKLLRGQKALRLPIFSLSNQLGLIQKKLAFASFFL